MLVRIAKGCVIAVPFRRSPNDVDAGRSRSGPKTFSNWPAATISGPILPASKIALYEPHVAPSAGIIQSEYFASGTARSYTAKGELGNDGRWTAAPAKSAHYETRIVVRAPRDAKKFNGTVLVEWMNVSGGFDFPTELAYTSAEIERGGYAWVGVSVQKIGVGDDSAAPGRNLPGIGPLKSTDPARYASLTHPGDEFSFDIFSQVGRALREPSGIRPLGDLRPKRLLAAGESQSAILLTTYVNAIQPTAKVFDGFLIHSRAGGAYPIAGGTLASVALTGSIRIRTDLKVPVLIIATESDEVNGYFFARQPDTDRVRLWDIAGSSHVDSWLVPASAAPGCGEINEAPTHYVLAAALNALNSWAVSGVAPPPAPRLDVENNNGKLSLRRDANGNAIGGIRTATVDAPIAAYSGLPGPGAGPVCFLWGSTQPFSAANLAALYPTRSAYVDAVTKATDRAIRAGHILAADRAAILATAKRAQL